MKILLLSLNWVEYLIEMANALAKRGHQVHIILENERVRLTVGDDLNRLLDPRVKYYLVANRRLGLKDPRQLATVFQLIRLISKIKPDIINLHEETTTYLPLCLGFFRRLPLILTVHDVMPHPGSDSEEPARRKRVREHFRRRADAVILHGEWLRGQYLAQSHDFCKNTHAIPHGCYTVFKHWAKNDVAELANSVLFFGRIHEYKGLDYLLRAADIVEQTVSTLKVIIAGDGNDLLLPPRRLESGRYEVYRGYLSNERVAETFQRASVVVLPYIEGSQSGVVRIAYTFGKPVIATRVGSIPESVKHGETGLIIAPRDEVALANAIMDLLQNCAKRKAMGRAATQMMMGELCWDAVAEKTEKVFKQALKLHLQSSHP